MSARRCPALFIAAPASGQGKTTLTAALAHLHRRAGRSVRVFKCGPDFLDPQILAAASGAPVYNLDLWMCGARDASARLFDAAAEADLILVEGVMGLYDGDPSGAAIARRFGLPVLAVIDASAMAQTFGALALGLRAYDPELRFAGVLANNAGHSSHAAMLRRSLPRGMRWLGHLARNPAASLPERHLGLSQASEIADLAQRLDPVADALATLPAAALPAPVEFARHSLPATPRLLDGMTIAVARDEAFAFVYPANVDCLARLGATLKFFAPLASEELPECDALWLPGGYPELHAARLAANRGLLESLRAHHAAGRPMLAECGGMMALFERLVDLQGRAHRLTGLIPGEVAMQPRLAALDLQRVDFPAGRLRGHCFHYSRAATPLEPWLQARSKRGLPGEAIFRVGTLTASYVHCYFASNPAAAASLFLD